MLKFVLSMKYYCHDRKYMLLGNVGKGDHGGGGGARCSFTLEDSIGVDVKEAMCGDIE
jgi:hypothetical protein